LPSVLHNPALGGAYVLRPPKLPPSPEGAAPPAVYSEEEMRRACREAEEAGREAARSEFERMRADLEAETRSAVGVFTGAASALQGERVAVLEESAQQVVDLALRLARAVVRARIEADPGAVLPLVRELLQRAAAAGSLTIRLSPRDHAHLTANADSLPGIAGTEGLRLRADAAVPPGGCVLETEAGKLDARVETQWERIEEALRPGRNEE
jgi:flagellar biosynthesis/type III secretory pathway protein FliH